MAETALTIAPQISKLDKKQIKLLEKLMARQQVQRNIDLAAGLVDKAMPVLLGLGGFVFIDWCEQQSWKRTYTLPNGEKHEVWTDNTLMGNMSATAARAGVAAICALMALKETNLIEQFGSAAGKLIDKVPGI